MARPDQQQQRPAAVQQQIRFPAPVLGNNTVDNVMSMGPEYSYIANNFVSRPYGLEIRKGYREWLQKGVTLPANIGTLMSFSNPGSTSVKLFACSEDVNNVVYDLSLPNTALPALPYPQPPLTTATPWPPTTLLTHMQTGAGAQVNGEWSWVNYNTPTTAVLCAQLFGKGYYQYSPLTGWVQVASKITTGAPAAREVQFEYPTGTFHDASTMLFVFSFKNRLWFLQGGTGLAFFLPLNSIYGKAGVIDLGQFLQHGGGLAYAVDWTYDSGKGIDDRLIFVGNNGDMVVYEGTDPSSATDWKMIGLWYVGRIPKGRRGFDAYAGDVVIVTEYGVISISDLVSGRITNMMGQSSIAPKVNPTIARAVSTTINEKYWQLVNYPTEELLMLLSPARTLQTSQRFDWAMSHFNRSWTTFTVVEPYTAVLHEGQFIFSDRNGKVYQGFYGPNDNASYDGTVEGDQVTAQFQTGFHDYGTPNSNKRAQRVRILGRSDGHPTYLMKMVPEYDLDDLPTPGGAAVEVDALWNVALWDAVMWQSHAATWKKWFGVSSFGKRLALQAAVRGSGYTLVTDYEITFETGIGL
jgi:hypothetical protein